ncbi:MAG: lamin tail domain-containing protein, partial [Thermoleophilaceae bacterium]
MNLVTRVTAPRVKRRTLATFLLALVALGAVVAVAAAQAPSRTGIVISEFRFRGPSGGNDEFVELRNSSAAPIDVSGFKLQGCSSGTGAASDRATIDQGVTLNPGQSFLFANSTASGGFSGTVAPDKTFTTGFTDTSPINFSGAQVVDTAGTKVDGVGAPQSPCREGTGILTPAMNPTGQSSFERIGGTLDTDNNSTDFQAKAPSDPQNRTTNPGEAEPTPINKIQGDGQTSPLVTGQASSSSPGSAGETVTIEGVVTGVDDEVGQSRSGRIFENERGIFVQEEARDQDEDPNTSEAIFVGFVRDPTAFYTPGVGQVVRVTGRVRELFGFTIIEEQREQEPERRGVAPQPMPTQINEQQAEAQKSSDPDA